MVCKDCKKREDLISSLNGENVALIQKNTELATSLSIAQDVARSKVLLDVKKIGKMAMKMQKQRFLKLINEETDKLRQERTKYDVKAYSEDELGHKIEALILLKHKAEEVL